MADLVIVEPAYMPGIASITLNSPGNRNALSRKLLDGLSEALLAVSSQPSLKAVLLQASGPAFCAGADLKAVQTGNMSPILSGIIDVQRAMLELDAPVVAKVSGAVRAGGIGLVAASDIAIGCTRSDFAFTEVRLGLVAAAVSLTVLPRIGPRHAAELLLTGRKFDGRTAQEIGLLSRAVPRVYLDTVVDAVLAELAHASVQGLSATKSVLTAPVRNAIYVRAAEMVKLSSELFSSDEARRLIGHLKA